MRTSGPRRRACLRWTGPRFRAVSGVTKKFDQRLFDESIERVRQNRDHGLVNPRPTFDPQQHTEHRDNHVQRRSIEDYRAVLENYGFSYLPDPELMLRGLPPTGSGRWTNWQTQDAFTNDDVLSMFPTPEDFHKWFRKRAKATQLARAVKQGDLTPDKRRIILAKS